MQCLYNNKVPNGHDIDRVLLGQAGAPNQLIAYMACVFSSAVLLLT